MAKLRTAALCAGYGGLEMGLTLAGVDHELAWFSEIESGPEQVINHHHPNAPNLGDLTLITDPPPVDIVTAGFPCQTMSHAGKGEGLGDSRWIINDVVRLWKQTDAPWLVLENVSAITSGSSLELFCRCGWSGFKTNTIETEWDEDEHAIAWRSECTSCGSDMDESTTHVIRRWWLGEVLRALAEVGATARWTCLRASHVGACHRRERWFCVAQTADANKLGFEWPGPAWHGRAGSSHDDRQPVATLPTPTAGDGTGGHRATNLEWKGGTAYRPSAAKASVSLQEVIDLLPTPRTGSNRNSRSSMVESHSMSGPGLEQALEWAQGVTPRELSTEEALAKWPVDQNCLLPTPIARDYKDTRGMTVREGREDDSVPRAIFKLQRDADLLPTPTASQPGGTAEQHLERKRGGKMNRANPTVTDLRMTIEHQQLGSMHWQKYAAAIERHEQVLGREAPAPTVNGKLSPRFVEFMMMLPDGHVTDVIERRTTALKLLGNGVVPLQAAAAISQLAA